MISTKQFQYFARPALGGFHRVQLFGKNINKILSRRPITILVIVILSIFLAYIDYFLPSEVPIDSLYTIPIWLGLTSFGLFWGAIITTACTFLFYISNFLPLHSVNPEHFWSSMVLTYAMLMTFNFAAYKYQQNRQKLDDAHKKLQNRLVVLDQVNKQAQSLHEKNLKLAVMDERNRIAREIHDVLAQGFTAIILQVEATQLKPDTPPEIQERLSQIDRLARYNLQEARRSVANLRPQPLDSASLFEALEQKVAEYQTEHKIEALFNSSGQVTRLPVEVETALLRITQEALSNVAKHSKAAAVTVSLDYDEEEACLTVQDTGKGFDQHEKDNTNGATFGLSTMQERARLVGGLTTIQSKPGEGCRVRVIVPYTRPAAELLISNPVNSATGEG